jgi:cytochrome c oxidase assembly factor 6
MMGWFSAFQTPEQKRAEDIRTGAVAPTRSERQLCYTSRDAYFGCLDRANILDAEKNGKEAAKACPKETAEFERDCAAQWVSCSTTVLPRRNHGEANRASAGYPFQEVESSES